MRVGRRSSAQPEPTTLPEVDVRDYLDYLFAMPLWKRQARIETDLTLAAARTLRQLALRRRSKPILQLAGRLWALPLRGEWPGPVLPPAKIRKALETLSDAGLVPEQERRAAVAELEGFRPRSIPASATHVGYAGPDGSVYFPTERTIAMAKARQAGQTDRDDPKRLKSHYPADDLTFRLEDGFRALKEAGCKTPTAELTRALNARRVKAKQWSAEAVRKRLRGRKTEPRHWMASPYRQGYWLSPDWADRHSAEHPDQRESPPDRAEDLLQPFRFVWKRGLSRR